MLLVNGSSSTLSQVGGFGELMDEGMEEVEAIGTNGSSAQENDEKQ